MKHLNQRPLGYEPKKSMARLCLSTAAYMIPPRFSTVFWRCVFMAACPRGFVDEH